MRYPNQTYSRRRSIRLRGYDYRQGGVYFITICCYQKMKLFGTIVDGDMVLSPLGEIARDELRHIAQARSNVELDLYVLMPNHLHGLFIITDLLDRDIAQCGKQSFRLPAGSLGAIIGQFKVAVTRRAKSSRINFANTSGSETITNISFAARSRWKTFADTSLRIPRGGKRTVYSLSSDIFMNLRLAMWATHRVAPTGLVNVGLDEMTAASLLPALKRLVRY